MTQGLAGYVGLISLFVVLSWEGTKLLINWLGGGCTNWNLWRSHIDDRLESHGRRISHAVDAIVANRKSADQTMLNHSETKNRVDRLDDRFLDHFDRHDQFEADVRQANEAFRQTTTAAVEEIRAELTSRIDQHHETIYQNFGELLGRIIQIEQCLVDLATLTDPPEPAESGNHTVSTSEFYMFARTYAEPEDNKSAVDIFLDPAGMEKAVLASFESDEITRAGQALSEAFEHTRIEKAISDWIATTERKPCNMSGSFFWSCQDVDADNAEWIPFKVWNRLTRPFSLDSPIYATSTAAYADLWQACGRYLTDNPGQPLPEIGYVRADI